MSADRISARSVVLLLLVALAAQGCATLRFYGQAVRGGLGTVMRAERIERVLARPETPAEVARQLELVLDVRRFAAEELGLDVGKSYRSFVALEREVAVWNVVAAPELEVEPLVWCFPVAGCVSYRGYFRRAGAERFAARLDRKGLDVAISGATAYSTLGWLRDPVLSTFLGGSDAQLVGLLLHEMAHRTLYARGDTAFNESYASVVERAGVRRWLENGGRGDEWDAYARHGAAEREVLERLATTRDALAELYATSAGPDAMRRRKAAILERFQADLARDMAERPALEPWRGWTEGELNNAHLASVGVYWRWVPVLESELERLGWPAFLVAMRALAERPDAERHEVLEALESAVGAAQPGSGSSGI